MKKANKSSPKQLRLILSVVLVAIILVCGYFFGGKNLFDTDDLSSASSRFIDSSSVSSEVIDPSSASSEVIDPSVSEAPTSSASSKKQIDENGIYTSKEDVALYILTYKRLPSNFIKKSEAEKLGWSGGGLDRYAKNKCIGGDRFGNYEGALPKKQGRTYTECDIDTLGAKSRGAKRIVFSNDGLIYYTDDHYETFTLLYGDE